MLLGLHISNRISILAAICLAAVWFSPGCTPKPKETVVVYVALDEMYARPILDRFERETGVRVLAQYDTEASKTTGIVNRLLAERERPRADVFWNNEVAQTIVLKDAGALEPYASPAAEAIPDVFKDPEGYWTGFAARARVIIYNTDVVERPPDSVMDLLKPQWRGRAAIANPLFGSTATHAGALFAVLGEERAEAFFDGLTANGVAVLPGNATVRDLVARGEFAWGLTDTDDANGAIEDGFPVARKFPDQEDGGLGTLVIPNTVALIKGGPHAEAGKRLIDYLLSPEVEDALSRTRSIQIPLNPAVSPPENVPRLDNIKMMSTDFEAIAAHMQTASAYLREAFVR